MSELSCRIAALHLHPIKSCRGILQDESLLVETGLDLDRAYMVVDAAGHMLTQRQWPRLALVVPRFKSGGLELRAPGMLPLHLHLEAVEGITRVTVWDDELPAFDMGPLAAQWFTDFLGFPARLARFDPERRRLSNPKWTGTVQAEVAFADGFAVLVASLESLAEVNRRLLAAGHAAVTMERFRPNLVLEGLQAFDEDFVDELTVTTEEGPVRIKLVKPCVRCSVPNVEPSTAESLPTVGDTLAQFRADRRMDGGITFGMNAIVLEGVDRVLRVGQAATARLGF
jgi:uncharacterized protein